MKKKIICIDAGNVAKCRSFGMVPLKEGEAYTIREETMGVRGEGYLLEEIHNRCNIRDRPGIEPSYLKSRFIPLSTVEEGTIEEFGINKISK